MGWSIALYLGSQADVIDGCSSGPSLSSAGGSCGFGALAAGASTTKLQPVRTHYVAALRAYMFVVCIPYHGPEAIACNNAVRATDFSCHKAMPLSAHVAADREGLVPSHESCQSESGDGLALRRYKRNPFWPFFARTSCWVKARRMPVKKPNQLFYHYLCT